MNSTLATSASDGTNLPNLAEIYYLHNDVCIDRESEFDKTDPGRWRALKGQFQFCVQKQEAETSNGGFSTTKLLSSTTSLDWYRTTKYDNSAFCTKVESEMEDFCVAESVIDSLSIQMSSIFNTTASFSDMNRTDITYNSEWGPRLTRAVFGEGSDTEPSCPVKTQRSGGQNPNPFVLIGEYGFQSLLGDIAHSLSDTFRNRDYLQQNVFGTYTYQETVMLVDFRWFILPALLYGIVVIFFVATIFTTRDTPIWKSSPLALLHATKEEGTVESENSIRKEAKESRVTLRRTEKGWGFEEGEKGRSRGSLTE
ncbi:Nn.00g082930.m01.CDS01 [Neocucurbitaria sp. VM-36]